MSLQLEKQDPQALSSRLFFPKLPAELLLGIFVNTEGLGLCRAGRFRNGPFF